MVISLCIPCMNRTHDLKKVMRSLIKAANASPPVEICILDYNSHDDLQEYIQGVVKSGGDAITYHRYYGREHYHMAHARNLSVLASKGEYVVISSTDIQLDIEFFSIIRRHIENFSPMWMNFDNETGVLIIRRQEFVAAGGFDERFEFYGSEDIDLYLRLLRRGSSRVTLPGKLFHANYTPDEVKVQNYREPLTKAEMDQRGKVYYWENIDKNVLVANPKGWGAWTE